jgi:hypothetical protein
MKKLLLLCSIVFYCLSATSQSFTASPSTVNSGSTVTFTGNGESAVAYFAIVNSYSLSPTSTPVTAALTAGSVKLYNASTNTPTSLKMTFTNTTGSAQNVTIWFACTVNNSITGTQNTSYQTAVSITVNPTPPSVYYSAAYSKSFTRNNCSTGYQGTSVVYSIPAGHNTSTVSQAAADQAAINYVNANGQNYANTNGTCKIAYYNAAISQTFTKNSCALGYLGSTVTYTVPANTYNSIVSQADANSKAQNDINLNGQNYANSNGVCTVDPNYYPNLTGSFTAVKEGTNQTTTLSLNTSNQVPYVGVVKVTYSWPGVTNVTVTPDNTVPGGVYKSTGYFEFNLSSQFKSVQFTIRGTYNGNTFEAHRSFYVY